MVHNVVTAGGFTKTKIPYTLIHRDIKIVIKTFYRLRISKHFDIYMVLLENI